MTPPVHQPVWDDHRGTPLPRLAGDAEADLCVVGLGGTGLSALREALDLGQRVIGIDAGSVGGAAAGRNGGLLLAGVASFHHDAVQRLGRTRARSIYELTLEQIARTAEETPDAVRLVGSLRLATTPAEELDCQAQLAQLREDGLPAAGYHGPEGRGILVPSDAAFNPLQRCRLLAGDLARHGAPLFEHTPALHIEPGRVDTPGGTIRAGSIIIAVDGRLAQVVPALAPRIRTARLQMLATAPAVGVRIPRPVYARFGMEYWQQLPGGEIAVGGFRDLAGGAEWTSDTQPTPVIQDALEDLLRNGLRVQAAVTHRWAASVSYVEGELPILEEVHPSVWAMGAYNGTGNLIGALCGRAAVQLAVRGESAMGELLGAVRARTGKR
jgi:glycine/D-amino acid oxidase-like deaminating enzyme